MYLNLKKDFEGWKWEILETETRNIFFLIYIDILVYVLQKTFSILLFFRAKLGILKHSFRNRSF